MKPQTATRLAWTRWVFIVLLALGGILLLYLASRNQPRTDWLNFLGEATCLLDALGVGFVGALITARRPANAIGWLMCAAVFAVAGEDFCERYAFYALMLNPGSLPGAIVPLWFAQSLWFVPNIGLFLLLLLFPTGHFSAPIWRWAAVVALIGAGTIVLFLALLSVLSLPDGADFAHTLPNPIGLLQVSPVTLSWLGMGINLYLITIAVAGVVALGLRFYHAAGVERQQMKWFTYAAILFPIINIACENLIQSGWSSIIDNMAALGIPAAIGIAILQHRLFDIDIIRRTLVYTLLTGLLLLIYFGTIVVLQRLVQSITGRQENQLITVFSTLAIAALFVPLRQHVQGIIDQRLYRHKYDAEQVLHDFSRPMRDEVELDRLMARLLAVVDETLQPQSISLWLKKRDR